MKRAISFASTVLLISVCLQAKSQIVKQVIISPISNSTSIISNLKPVLFNYDKKWADKVSLPTSPQYGFLAEEVKTVLPEAVFMEPKSYQSGKNKIENATVAKVDNDVLVPFLVGSIKELQQQIDSLKQEIESLKSRNAK